MGFKSIQITENRYLRPASSPEYHPGCTERGVHRWQRICDENHPSAMTDEDFPFFNDEDKTNRKMSRTSLVDLQLRRFLIQIKALK